MSAQMRLGTVCMVALLASSLSGCGEDEPSPMKTVANLRTDSQVAINRAPTIAGTPATSAKTNALYAFQPQAADPDGDALTFQVENKPAWASFDSKTGRLSGTPTSSSAGTFAGIRIRASDGTAEAALPPFDIVVDAMQVTGSATLSWQPPTQKIDGSPLTDLAGYVIRYGTRADVLDSELRLGNPGLTTYVIENLTSATWYFALTAFTASGAESAPSQVTSKTIS